MGKRFQGVWIYLLVAVLIYFAINGLGGNAERIPEIDYNEAISLLDEGKVESVRSTGNDLYLKTEDGKEHYLYLSFMTANSFYEKYLQDRIDSGEVIFSAEKVQDNSWQMEIVTTILMIGGFAIMWIFLMRTMQGGGGNKGAMNFGKSKAILHQGNEKIDITFDDVAGLMEEKEELEEIVDFLKEPRKYAELGARIPTGVLMVGPPGTGKTYLSKAVAGEAKVPFFTISGSDFVEMFVGVGASRVRDLFENAKKNAPAIVFIDEIDAVGRRRGAGVGGGHDEREQTLNQLLVEMDGFSGNEGVIIMAATNRADILDPALLRPGRFDRTIYVGAPDVRGREEILKIHTKNKPLAEDVDLKTIAKRTPGFTPADLENMVNEAALLSARENKNLIDMETINEASIKVQAGPAKKSAVVSERDRKITAVHEAGHALVSRLTPGSDPVHMITIIPRGMAGGFTAYVPDDDDQFITKTYLENQILSLLGGRVAEDVILGEISTGASNDIERATKIARAMVTTFGMSENLGTIKYGEEDHEVFMGRDFSQGRGYSEEIAAKIDREVMDIIKEAYRDCYDLIKTNRETLERISDALLERETLNAEEFEKVFKGEELEAI